ncbi:MAG: hypothetical protein MPN21_09215 [Thermoanaerobaculia bacterium]|nr:hypothetical protein [Thermoanaerobaculia bacterium]
MRVYPHFADTRCCRHLVLGSRRRMGDKDSSRPRPRVPDVPALPLLTRVLLIVLGWLLVLLGVAGLVLPGLQGILTIALGAAVLSLTSRVMLRTMRWCFQPWPKGWKRMLALRAKVLRWLTRDRPDDPGYDR